MASMGGVYMLPVSAEHRQGAAAVSAGDEVEVELALETRRRRIEKALHDLQEGRV